MSVPHSSDGGTLLSLSVRQNSREGFLLREEAYPDGGREYSITPNNLDAGRMAGDAGQEADSEGDGGGRRAPRSERDHSREGGRRAARKVMKRIRHLKLYRMATLTFPGKGIHDYSTAQRLVSEFIHRHGECIHSGSYVAVPELHPSGHGWHWHVMTGKRFDQRALAGLMESWTSFLAGYGVEPSGGARFVRVHVKARWRRGRLGAALYASKYVAKTFLEGHVGKGRQRYLTSEGDALPEPVVRWFPSWGLALRALPHRSLLDYFLDGRAKGFGPFVFASSHPPWEAHEGFL